MASNITFLDFVLFVPLMLELIHVQTSKYVAEYQIYEHIVREKPRYEATHNDFNKNLVSWICQLPNAKIWILTILIFSCLEAILPILIFTKSSYTKKNLHVHLVHNLVDIILFAYV